jgi:hypothetical protein
MSDLENQLARTIPKRSVQQWRLLRPFLPPALRQWIEAAARAMCASRLPYPLAMQQLDRVIGRRSGPSSPASPRPDDAAVLRHCVILEMASAHAIAPNAESAAPPPCCPMPAPIRISPEVQKYVRSASGRMLAEPSVKSKAWLPANFRSTIP